MIYQLLEYVIDNQIVLNEINNVRQTKKLHKMICQLVAELVDGQTISNTYVQVDLNS